MLRRLTTSTPFTRRTILLLVAAAVGLFAWMLAAAKPSHAGFPGGNGKIAFTFFTGNFSGSGQIDSVNPDGSAPTNLSAAGGGGSDNDVQPAWSADGTKIAFDRQTATNPQIWVMNADGTGQANISNNAFVDQNPAWSPDGTKIVFRSNELGGGIWVMNADGTGRVQLTTVAADGTPAWSPDGAHILFTRGASGFHNTSPIFVMDANGANPHQITTGIKGDWFPDSSKIALARFNATSNRDEIHVLNADGSGDQTVIASSTDDFDSPAWAPDGTQIAYVDCSVNFCEVGVAGADGSNPHTITGSTSTGPDTGVKPDWQPVAPAAATPTITGNTVNGQTLTAHPAASSPGTSTSLQWLRCDASGNGCAPIPGATGTTYTLMTADIGHAIRVRETVSSRAGSTSSDSAPTAAVAPNPAACSNVFTGTNGNDTINGTSGGDRISGLGGSDTLNGLAGRDCISGGSAGDRISGGSALDRLSGNGGNDRVSGGSGNDSQSGGSGNDSLSGGSGRDRQSGGSGNDRLSGGGGRDRLSGGSGKDRLSGDAARDTIFGGSGNDTLLGGSGNDRISVGGGRNRAFGGAGNDRINSVNGRRDRVNCGSGRRDVARADKKDRVRGCERVVIV
jgi:Tol biopolymer transport system component